MISELRAEDLVAFEEKIAKCYAAGSIPGPVHLSFGNEAPLLSVFEGIQEEDWVFSTHRSHYHALLKGIPPDWLEEEILAGRSITINAPRYRFFSSAIVGDNVSIATGVALGLKLRNDPAHVWCFVGDMFAEMGAFFEAVKYSQRNDLPITFVVEDNGVSVCTPTQESWGTHEVASDKVMKYTYHNTRYPHAGVSKIYSGF